MSPPPRKLHPYCRSEHGIGNKQTAQHRAISSAQAACGIINSLLVVAPNHGPLLYAPFTFSCILPCARVERGVGRPRSGALINVYQAPGTWYEYFLSCLFLLFLSLLFFPFLSLFVFRFLVFSFLYLFLFCLFFPIDLRLSCVCVVIGTTCNIYLVRGSLSWVASGIVGFSRRE